MVNPKIRVLKSKNYVKTFKICLKPLKSTFSDFAKSFHLDYFNDVESCSLDLGFESNNLYYKLRYKSVVQKCGTKVWYKCVIQKCGTKNVVQKSVVQKSAVQMK